jgi:hypothetical protein
VRWVTRDLLVSGEFLLRSVLIGPEEGAHGKLPLAVEVAADGEAVLPEQAVDAPLGHGLVVPLLVPRVVQRHLEGVATALLVAALLIGGGSGGNHTVLCTTCSAAGSLLRQVIRHGAWA